MRNSNMWDHVLSNWTIPNKTLDGVYAALIETPEETLYAVIQPSNALSWKVTSPLRQWWYLWATVYPVIFSQYERSSLWPLCLQPTCPNFTHPRYESLSRCLSLQLTRYFDRGSIWIKLTHFVSGNQSRETEEGETGKAAAALIPPTGSVKSAFHKGCSPVMSPTEWQIGPPVL